MVDANVFELAGLAELLPDFLSGFGNHGVGQHHRDAQGFGGAIQNRLQIVLLFYRPGFRNGEELIDLRNQLPDRADVGGEIETFESSLRDLHRFGRVIFGESDAEIVFTPQRRFGWSFDRRNRALKRAINHGQSTAGEIAEAVGQIGVVTGDERFAGEISVLAEDNFAEQVVAQRVVAQGFHNGLGVGHVAFRLAHFFGFKEQPTMSVNAFRQGKFGSHQKCGPVDRVEPNDFFADHVQVGRPIFLEPWIRFAARAFTVADAGHVAGERVVPDVENVLGIAGPGDAPFDGFAADRDVFEAAFHEAADFVEAEIRLNEIRLGAIQLEQAILIARQLEEIIFLGN